MKPFSITFSSLLKTFTDAIDSFPDQRTGKNSHYSMQDIALGGFSVFFTQSPSFLDHQKTMKELGGISNAETLFGIDKIPSDNHIRTHLDPVSPSLLSPVFNGAFQALAKTGHLDTYRSYQNNLLIALDGTWYHSSQSIHCDQCSSMKHKNGSITYYHSAITPVVVAPGKDKVIALAPEFITPQDGHTKQDCENTAAKRWFDNASSQYSSLGVTILGDDLYSRQPICEKIKEKGFHFILVCKPDSHKTLYNSIELLSEGKDKFQFSFERWNGKSRDTYTYQYANEVPLRDSEDAMKVNWCQLTIANDQGEVLYKNAFITDFKIKRNNVEAIINDGRARWKIENENNNVLKTKGYHLEHNFGHGKEYLSMLLMTFNLIAFLFHTILELCDKKYRLLRAKLPSRKSFFDDMRALTRYLCYDSWEHLMDFMLKGLEKKLRAPVD